MEQGLPEPGRWLEERNGYDEAAYNHGDGMRLFVEGGVEDGNRFLAQQKVVPTLAKNPSRNHLLTG
jgi:hypothetical protein